LAENVSGMLLPRHKEVLENIKGMFSECGYDLSFHTANASKYGVPQDRQRVFFIGYRKDLKIKFSFPLPTTPTPLTLKEAIWDLRNNAIPAGFKNHSVGEKCKVQNHEYMTGGFSSIYMSRNRVRSWTEVSFTIQAGGRQAPIHPMAPKMELIGPDKRAFVKGQEKKYRRLTVRECARIQTFPDDFIFKYKLISDGYKMIGNAVPVNLAHAIAAQIKFDMISLKDARHKKIIKKKLSEIVIRERMNNLVNTSV
jgi:DNA (cytosine-5)-methyltransferase 1